MTSNDVKNPNKQIIQKGYKMSVEDILDIFSCILRYIVYFKIF